MSQTAAWLSFRGERDAQKKPKPRDIPLTDAILALVPADCPDPAQLATLIEEQAAEQAAEEAADERRHRRRQDGE